MTAIIVIKQLELKEWQDKYKSRVTKLYQSKLEAYDGKASTTHGLTLDDDKQV